MSPSSDSRLVVSQRHYRLAPAVGALTVAQLVLHIWFIISAGDRRMWTPHAVAWLLDVFVLLATAAVLGIVARGLRCCGISARASHCVSVAVLLMVGLVLSLYPASLTEFMAFPVNVLRADAATTGFFVSEYLGWRGLWPILVSGVSMCVGQCVSWPALSMRRRLAIVVPVLVLTAIVLVRPAPQPLMYAVQDTLRGWLLGSSRSVPSLTRPAPGSVVQARDAATAVGFDGTQPLSFDHVLVLVMEGVTADRFEREFLAQPQGYCAHVRDRSVYFAQYYTPNLDSYTSLIAMLTSVQVPYRAYADPSSYEAVNNSPNLVAALGKCGFRGLYVCTAEYQPFVPVRHHWNQIRHMHELNPRPDMQVMGGGKVESGVEDRAALSQIVDFIRSHTRSLIMQEMIFGHSPKWMARTGKDQLQYYDDYLLDLYRSLEQQQLADRVLWVLVSDHGDRADSFSANNYHVPLLISGRGIAPSRAATFYSHLELQQVVAHFLAGAPLPPARASLFTVGSTERWVYGEITANGSYMFIDNDRGSAEANDGDIDAQSLYEQFKKHLDSFAARYQQ